VNEAIIGFVGVLVGVIATVGKDLVSYWTVKRKAGRFAAVRLVCVLDQYVEKCVEVVGDDGTAYGQPAGRTEGGEEYYAAQVRLPDPPAFPDDIDWTSINPELMYRALALPNLASVTDRFIGAVSEHSFPPDYSEMFQARWEGYADLGLEAASITAALRSRFDLPKSSIEIGNPDWDSVGFLQKTKNDAVRARKAQRAMNAKMWEELDSKAPHDHDSKAPEELLNDSPNANEAVDK